MSPTTPRASSSATLPQPSFQTYSPIYTQPMEQPSNFARQSTASPPVHPASASRTLPFPSFPLPDLNAAPPSMLAFEAKAAEATAAAHHISALAAEDVMNALRFVPSGAAKDAARELQEPVGQQLQQQLQRMTLSDAMQPLDDVCYSDDKTMVS